MNISPEQRRNKRDEGVSPLEGVEPLGKVRDVPVVHFPESGSEAAGAAAGGAAARTLTEGEKEAIAAEARAGGDWGRLRRRTGIQWPLWRERTRFRRQDQRPRTPAQQDEIFRRRFTGLAAFALAIFAAYLLAKGIEHTSLYKEQSVLPSLGIRTLPQYIKFYLLKVPLSGLDWTLHWFPFYSRIKEFILRPVPTIIKTALGYEGAKVLQSVKQTAKDVIAEAPDAEGIVNRVRHAVQDAPQQVADKVKEGINKAAEMLPGHHTDAVGDIKDTAERLTDRAKDYAQDKVDNIRYRAKETAAEASDTAGSLKDRAKEAIGDAWEHTKEALHLKSKPVHPLDNLHGQLHDAAEALHKVADSGIVEKVEGMPAGSSVGLSRTALGDGFIVESTVVVHTTYHADETARAKVAGRDIVDKAKETAEDVKETSETLLARATEYVKETAENIADKVKNVATSVKDAPGRVAEGVSDAYESTKDKIQQTMHRGANELPDVKEPVEKVAHATKRAADKADDVVQDTASHLADKVKYGTAKAKDIIDRTVERAENVVRGTSSDVKDKAKDVADSAEDAAEKHSGGIGGFFEHTKDTIEQALHKGVDAIRGHPSDKVIKDEEIPSKHRARTT